MAKQNQQFEQTKLRSPHLSANQSLQYNFILDGGRSNQLLSLVNPTAAPISVQAIQVTSNADITNPWQIFGEQWDNVTVSQQDNLYTYTLNLAQPISIAPGQTSVLEYSVGTALGPITNVSMPPQQIQIQLQGQDTWQLVNFASANPPPNPHPNIELNVYHASWGQYSYQQTMATEAWSDINCLTYAFIGFDEDGNVFTLDNWGDQLELPNLALFKKQFPYLKATLSFGGWTNNGQMMAPVFSQMTANPTALTNFVNNAVAAVAQANLDGIDIDWEYPETPQDAANYILLLQQLRAKLPPGARLTIAAPAGIDKISVFTPAQWQQITGLVDRISVMSYDYFGAFSSYSDFHSAWQLSPNSPNYSDPVLGNYCVSKTLTAYQNVGVPAQKISMGIPNYSRSMIVAQAGEYAGLYQQVIGAPQGDFPGANGIYSWNSIQAFLNKQPSPLDALGVSEWNYYDSTHPLCVAANMCLLSGQLPNGQWVVINFTDPTTTNWRAQQAVTTGLGGTMIWANYLESTNPSNKIVDAISAGLDNTLSQQQTVQTKAVPVATKLYAEECVHAHANYLRDAFFAKRKQTVLNQLVQANSAIQTAELINRNKGTLSQHRNIFKRALSAILPSEVSNFILGKPESLILAERLLAVREVIEKTRPTRIISTHKNKPDVVKSPVVKSSVVGSYNRAIGQFSQHSPTLYLVPAAQAGDALTGMSLPIVPIPSAPPCDSVVPTLAPASPHHPQYCAYPQYSINPCYSGVAAPPLPINPAAMLYQNTGDGQVAPAYNPALGYLAYSTQPAPLPTLFAQPHVTQRLGVVGPPPPTYVQGDSQSYSQ